MSKKHRPFFTILFSVLVWVSVFLERKGNSKSSYTGVIIRETNSVLLIFGHGSFQPLMSPLSEKEDPGSQSREASVVWKRQFRSCWLKINCPNKRRSLGWSLHCLLPMAYVKEDLAKCGLNKYLLNAWMKEWIN